MAARDKVRRSLQEGAESLFLPTEQIKGIMQNKDKFVVTNLRSQHFYFMKKKLNELSSVNNRNNSTIIKRSQDNINTKNIHNVNNNSNTSNNSNNSYLLLTSLISQKKAASLQHNQSQDDISKYRLEPGGYCHSRSIEEMLDQVGYDIRSHECQPQISRSEQNALKKRTFFNSNRGMDLFEDPSPFQFSSGKYLIKNKQQGQQSRLAHADSHMISSMNRSMEELNTKKIFKNNQKNQQQPSFIHEISQFSLPNQPQSSLNINHNIQNINNINNNSNHLPSLPIYKTKLLPQENSGKLTHKRNRSPIKNERKTDESSLLFTEGDAYYFENEPQASVSSSILADFAKGHKLPPISSNPITIQQHQHPQPYNNHQITKLKH